MVEALGPVYEQIERSEYDIHWQPGVGAFMAPNRAHNLRFKFLDDGVILCPRERVKPQLPGAVSAAEALLVPTGVASSDATSDWSATVRLECFGRAGSYQQEAGPAVWSLSENKAQVQGAAITMQYLNDKQGLRQDFRVHQRPAGTGALLLQFAISRQGLDMLVDEPGNCVYFIRVDDRTKPPLSYSDLKAFDANQQVLEAHIISIDGDHFAIAVQDEGAQYPILIDPLYGYQSGGSENDPGAGTHYGYSLAWMVTADNGAGAAAGPNQGGLLIGAPWFDSGGVSQAGKVFLYDTQTGNGVLPTTSTWSYTGTQYKEHLGWCVADGGKYSFNGTGKPQSHIPLVGAPNYTSTQTNEGAVFAFYPDSNGNYGSSPNWTVTGGSPNVSLGWSVAGFVDFNKDGYPDVVVGVPNYSSGYQNIGQARMYYGSASGFNTTIGWTVYGSVGGATLGFSVAFGDVNGDGYPDVVVGAPGHNAGATFVYLNNGSGSLHTSPDTSLAGGQTGDEFGYVVASRYDQDGDGKADLLVGAPMATFNSVVQAGELYLFRGTSGGVSTTAAWSDGGNQSYEYFGTSAALGEMNGDSYPDIIVGAPSYSETGLGFTLNGKAALYITDPTVGGSHLPSLCCYNTGLCSYLQLGISVAYAEYLVHGNKNMIAGGPGNYGGNCVNVQVWYYQ